MAEAILDDTLDTTQIDPEMDGVGVDSASLPRRGTATQTMEHKEVQYDGDIIDYDESTATEDVTDGQQAAAGVEIEMPETDESSSTLGEAEIEFPAELLTAAGLTEEQARAQYTDPTELAQAVRFLDARHISVGRQNSADFNQSQQEQIDLTAPEWELPEREDGLDWDADTKRVFKQLSEHTKQSLTTRDKLLEQQRARLEQIQQQQQSEAQRHYIQEFDAFVNALPDEWAGVLGRGSGFELNPQSMYFQNRLYLEQTANALQTGRTASGFQPLSRDELMVRALGVAFPDVRERQVRQEVVRSVEQRKQSMINRPTQRRSTPLTKDEKAIQSANAWFKAHGLDDLDNMISYDEL